MYTFLLTGTKGMNDAVWKKIYPSHVFGASHQTASRPMHDWEACNVHISGDTEDALKKLKEVIGPRLIKKYMIHFD